MAGYERRIQPNGKVLIRVVVGYDGDKPIRKSKTFPNDVEQIDIDDWVMQHKDPVRYEQDEYNKALGIVARVGSLRRAKYFGVSDEEVMRRVPPKGISPNALIKEWLASKKGQVEESTYKGYETTCKLYLLDKFKSLSSEAGVKDGLKGLKRQDGKPLSPYTLEKVRTLLNMVLDYGVEKHLILTRPKLPKAGKGGRKKTISVLSIEQTDALRQVLRDRGEIGLETLLDTGLRISELLALEPRHLVDGAIQVDQALSNRWGYREAGLPKSDRSYRTLIVDPDLMGRLKKLEPTAGFLIATGQTGLSKRLKKICKELSLPPMGLHSLRHNHCTYLLSKGANVVAVSARLGHANAAFTLRTYAHLVPNMEQGLLEALTPTS